MRFSSPSRRAGGLLAVTTIGLSTAVLGVMGAASAATLTPASSNLVITAGSNTCSIDWTVKGGDGGSVTGAHGGTSGGLGQNLEFTTAVSPGATFHAVIGTLGSATGGTGVHAGGAGGAAWGRGGGGTTGLYTGTSGGTLIAEAGGGGGAGTLGDGGDADSPADAAYNADDDSLNGGRGGSEGGQGGTDNDLSTAVDGSDAANGVGGAGAAGAGGGGGGAVENELNGGGGGSSDGTDGSGGGGGAGFMDANATQDGQFNQSLAIAGDGYVTYTLNDCDTPNAPDIQDAYPGDTEATVEFWPAEIDEDQPVSTVTGYKYTIDDGAHWAALATTTVNADGDADDERTGTISGLTNDTAYTILIRATSASGDGAPSNASDPVTPHHYVDGPATAKLTGGPSSVTFSWTPSPDQAQVTGYSMEAYPQGYDQDPSTPGAPVMASCEAPANATSCVVAATPGYSYNGYVMSEEGDFGGGQTDTGATEKIVAPTAPSSVPTASAPLTSNDADNALAAGQQVTLSGAGYLPGSTVELTVYSTPVSLGQAVVAADGTFSATVTVPKDLANGSHHLVASGVDANGNPRYLVVAITVSGGTNGLAYTGFSALPYAGAGVLALLAGGGLLVAARRRQAA